MAEVSGTKNILCKYFKFGVCRNGAECLYSHDRDMKPVVPCKFYQRGTCAYGRLCRFDHVRPGASGTSANQGVNFREGSRSKPGATDAVNSRRHEPPKPVRSDESKASGARTPSGHPVDRRLWAGAPEFVPASSQDGGVKKTYAQAAGGRYIPEDGPVDPNDELCPFALAGECRYGAACLYIHGLPCDLCGELCLHPYNEEQRKQHRLECMMRHEEDMKHSFELAQSIDKTCGICYDVILEKPRSKGEQRFGILPSCNHVFCLTCIRKWRQQKENVAIPTKTARACPACRIPSDFVIPSRMWVEDKEEKAALIKSYKEGMRKKHCKHFNYGDGECPFGNKCFYRHETKDGKRVDIGPPKRRMRQNADGEVEMLQQILMWDFMDSSDLRNSFLLELDLLDVTESEDSDEDYLWGNGSDYELDDDFD